MSGGLKLYVKTYGCQMNVYDSERMAEALAPRGYVTVASMDEADLIVLNTCHIREKAVEKVYSELGRLKEIKDLRAEVGQAPVVAVAGCVAQAEGSEILARAPVVDMVVGPQSYHRLPELLDRLAATGKAVIETEFPEDDKFRHLPPRTAPRAQQNVRQNAQNPARNARQNLQNHSASAFLTVQEGCDKFCTFCVVPYTRGAEYGRPVLDLVEEARALVGRGVREITLLGQNVNAYKGTGPDGRPWSLARLLARLSEIAGVERLRYTTSHPRDMSADLIAAHATLDKLMPYLHLPFQSGSDRILAAMNRKHTAKEYLSLARRIREVRPDIALSTDIIVGFPGETEADFEATLEMVRTVGFAQAYSFKFSARPGTPAATMDGQLSETVKSDRLQQLQQLMNEQQISFNHAFVGKILPVLFDKPGRRTGQLIGRSPYLQSVHAEGPGEWLGRILEVEIAGAGPNSLSGVIKASQRADIGAGA